jgi:hypothetical protein
MIGHFAPLSAEISVFSFHCAPDSETRIAAAVWARGVGPLGAPPREKNIECISHTFGNNFALCSIRCKDLKTLTISTPSLRLDGKASGQTLTETGRL